MIVMLGIILAETTTILAKGKKPDAVREPGSKKRQVLVDTSSLIDGRILAVASTGFLGDELIITKSVLNELQFLADGSDADKRLRARFGLDVVSDLQKVEGLDVTIMQDDTSVREGVDNKLIRLAKEMSAMILTNDFNLNKVAAVEGVKVLNINDLSQNLRSSFLPGERLYIELIQKGSESGQAVGYLPDGTMVVVESGAKYIGKNIEVEFIRYLQTSAGKMMFAKIAGSERAQTRKAEYKKQDKPKKQYRKNYKKTPEDSLVNLANK